MGFFSSIAKCIVAVFEFAYNWLPGISLINRQSKHPVAHANRIVKCPYCAEKATVVARRNSLYFSAFLMNIFEIKKSKAYPVCSKCLNELPQNFELCLSCREISEHKSEVCQACGSKIKESER